MGTRFRIQPERVSKGCTYSSCFAAAALVQDEVLTALAHSTFSIAADILKYVNSILLGQALQPYYIRRAQEQWEAKQTRHTHRAGCLTFGRQYDTNGIESRNL